MSVAANSFFSTNILFSKKSTQLPRTVVIAVIFLCIIPYVLTIFGFSFASGDTPFDPNFAAQMAKSELIDAMFNRLTGAFTHALLEWTAFCAALFTVVLAFSHYSITRDITTPIIAIALFCAGCMDAFHSLAAARLIEGVAENKDLIPFTWAISRLFNALIMIVGVSLFLVKDLSYKHLGNRFIISVSIIFGIISYAIISYCANSASLPQTQFPNAFITRPYDVIPLVLFLFAGVYLYPKFYHKIPNLFTHALIISAIPEVVVELHMAFGSSLLFDSHFNIAHFLKILAYVVPLLGLSLDYARTYREQEKLTTEISNSKEKLQYRKEKIEDINKNLKVEIHTRLKAEQELTSQATELQRSNKELREFAYVASHDLQEPLRMVASYTQLLSRRYKGKLDEDADEFINFAVEGATRMQQLINDLLKYSRVDNKEKELNEIPLLDAYDWAIANLEMAIADSGSIITHDDLPHVMGDTSQLGQLLQNLITNAIKFRSEKSPAIHVSSKLENGMWNISVSDNGIGIEKEYRERIFVIFQRLHHREAYEGTGIGLALCKKIVEQHGGKIWVDSTPSEGSTFFFTLSPIEKNNNSISDKNNG